MPKSILPAWVGRMLIVGGACLALSSYSQLQPGSHESYSGLYQISIWFVGPAYLIIGLACFSLPARYRQQFEPLTRISLYAGGFGALMMVAGLFLTPIVTEWFWMVAVLGLILHIIGMVVFGCANITRPLLPMPRILPLITGLLAFLMMFSSQWRTYGGTDWVAFGYLLVGGIVWLVIGFFINSEKQPEAAPAAA